MTNLTAPVSLDLDAHYKVDGFRGIAFNLLGWAVCNDEPEWELVCDTDHEHDADCYTFPDDQDVILSDTWVRVVMVGDDRVHEVEYTDLHQIDEEAFCHECGQIGCTHDGRN